MFIQSALVLCIAFAYCQQFLKLRSIINADIRTSFLGLIPVYTLGILEFASLIFQDMLGPLATGSLGLWSVSLSGLVTGFASLLWYFGINVYIRRQKDINSLIIGITYALGGLIWGKIALSCLPL